MEKYNFELMERSKVDPLAINQPNGWVKIIYKMTESGAYCNEYPPKPYFYKIQKKIRKNGTLQSIKTYPYGEQIYYDEDGTVIKKYNTEDQFGKIKYDYVLNFLDKEGCINLKTGEGREYAIIENNRGYVISSRFKVYPPEEGQSYLTIIIPAAPWNSSVETIYHLDKDTGKVLHKESKEEYPII